ncbi:MAG: hypothetical protein ACK4J0_01905 [Candidatus Anstonellaceae archaeon]
MKFFDLKNKKISNNLPNKKLSFFKYGLLTLTSALVLSMPTKLKAQQETEFKDTISIKLNTGGKKTLFFGQDTLSFIARYFLGAIDIYTVDINSDISKKLLKTVWNPEYYKYTHQVSFDTSITKYNEKNYRIDTLYYKVTFTNIGHDPVDTTLQNLEVKFIKKITQGNINVNVEEVKKEKISLYLKENLLYIDYPYKIQKVILSNINGQILINQTDSNTLNLKDLADGPYFVIFQTTNKETFFLPLILH